MVNETGFSVFTRQEQGLPPVEEDPDKQAKADCKAQGGKWDEATKTCILPPPEPTPEPGPPKAKPALETFTDPRTGRASGITLPDGRTFLGLSSEDVARVARGEQERVARPEGTAPVGTAQAAADIERQQQFLQTTQAPVRRELDPTLASKESFPVLGPLLVKTRKLLGLSARSNSVLDLITGKAKDEPFFELQPEELKTIALTQIEKNEIEKGLTDSEEFGSWVEALGLGGMSNFAAEKPSENVQTILRRIKIAKTRATNAEIKVKDGTWRQAYGEDVITGLENDIQSFESRIKLLIQNSPELKFDSDGVNFIEDKILEARERLFSAKINMLSGAAKDPSEINVLIALRESIQEEDFEL